MQARELVLRPKILRHQLKADSDLGLLILITPVSLEREQGRAVSGHKDRDYSIAYLRQDRGLAVP